MIEKSKGGRPFLSTAEPTVKMEITLPVSLRDKLDRITTNRSAWVRQAIEAAKEPAKENKMITWSVQAALGLTDEQARAAEVRAARIEEAARPDGKTQYVPETLEYATREFRSKTLAGLTQE